MSSSEQQPLLPTQDAYNDVEANINGESRHAKWQRETAELLESPPLHYTVLSLVIIDSVCVLADLAYTVLSDTCTPIEGEDAPLWLNVLSHLSLVITTLFLVEIPVTLWALGPSYFNPFGRMPHAALHLFDAIIIVTTFVLEIVLRGKERELAALLIVLRLWRLVKLVGGIAVGAGDLEEENAKVLMETQQELEETRKALLEAQDENETLRKRVVWLENEGES
ncbi:hypothetical protein EIP91_010871 [Steccherinum ochraceum]|uniref:Voltage-gated hydrogen channel 1 n=1 Tax=Steccherinum ochraceum TaxID=92696 RepID=A0A4R0R049_9APHY|nr:hypothetical protein EIP91_010871 [Steccherinum ochraceum]